MRSSPSMHLRTCQRYTGIQAPRLKDYKKTRSCAVGRSRTSSWWLAVTTIATWLLTTALDIQEKLVTSKLRSTIAIAANSAISEARRKNRRALNAWAPNCSPWRNRRAHCLEPCYTGGPKNHVLYSIEIWIRRVSCALMENWRLVTN